MGGKITQEPAGKPRHGYLLTWLGGLVGTIVGGLTGWFGSVVYVEAFPRPGLQDIGVPLVYTPLAALVGAAFGVWGSLRVVGYTRPVFSAILFVLLLVVLVPAFALLGWTVLSTEMGAAFAVTLATLLAALAVRSRWFVQ